MSVAPSIGNRAAVITVMACTGCSSAALQRPPPLRPSVSSSDRLAAVTVTSYRLKQPPLDPVVKQLTALHATSRARAAAPRAALPRNLLWLHLLFAFIAACYVASKATAAFAACFGFAMISGVTLLAESTICCLQCLVSRHRCNLSSIPPEPLCSARGCGAPCQDKNLKVAQLCEAY